MGSMAVGGLLTGFDTKAVVDQLMAVERLAGNRITKAQTSASALSGVFTQLNGLVKSMGDAATAVVPDPLTKTNIWESAGAASSNKDVATVTAKGIAAPSNLTVRVDTVARAGAVMSGEIAVADRNTPVKSAPWSFSVTNHGTPTTIDFAAGDTLNTVAQKINEHKDADVNATVVKVRDGAYRLQLTSKTTGADTTLEVGGDVDAIGGPVKTLRAGADTVVTVGAGSEAEFSVSSKTATVDGLMDGVSITALTPGTTTITTTRDPDAIAAKVQAMVDAANAALSNVRINSKVDPNLGKATAGKDATNNSGLLIGNPTARSVTNSITDVFVGSSAAVPSMVGISVDKTGAITFDKAKFSEAYGKDPAAVEKTVTATAQKLADASKALTNATDGTLTAAIKGQDAIVKDYTDQAKRFDERMSAKQATLTAQYNALDRMLSKMKSQGDWLAGQLGALNNANSGNK
ncbi:flagellar filament capping protein FliD [Mobilicoccus sp.]|uniref:flagellar filament capping protein FliD n=1 Tax=Mobilicoccus sp. TaxID=2034349 RepID=UPI00289CEA18|nr:flagellar filament capping protein FliD [Mobilicoccus sp.]